MNRVLQAIIDAAVASTPASEGWILRRRRARLRVVAASGDAPGALLDAEIPHDEGVAGYVLASGQPVALSSGSDDPRIMAGIPTLLAQQPTAILTVPCADDDGVMGVLELVSATSAFHFDDVEMATLLASIAAVALAEASSDAAPPSPAELGRLLSDLARLDPARYAPLAGAVRALLLTNQ
ncbi:MAG TPA: GAF domain-containing protein [Acidimicrobiia bacterium]|jgi:GAF domain-containing protein